MATTTTINRARPIASNVLAVLSTGLVHGNTFAITAGQLDPKLYKAVNTVLEALGGKWQRKSRVHVFDTDPAEAIDRCILTASVSLPADYGFFVTPLPYAARLVNLADVQIGMVCLEPSAGTGNIAQLLAACVGWGNVTMVELHQQRATELQQRFPDAALILNGDFLTLDQQLLRFDRIVMNPPFARQQDIAHITHAYALLKPGGVLVSVAAAGVAFRQDARARAFRDLVDSCGWIEENPDDTFKESGTGVNTVTVFLRKG